MDSCERNERSDDFNLIRPEKNIYLNCKSTVSTSGSTEKTYTNTSFLILYHSIFVKIYSSIIKIFYIIGTTKQASPGR